MFPCQTRHGCPEAKVPKRKKTYCPMWYDGLPDGRQLLETRGPGETRVVRGCLAEILPSLLSWTVTVQEETKAEVNAGRAETMEATAKVIRDEVKATMLGALQDFSRAGLMLASPRQVVKLLNSEPKLLADDTDDAAA